MGFWENDNHCARRRGSCGWSLQLSSPTRLRQGFAGACGLGPPKLRRRRQAGDPVFQKPQSSPEKPRRTGSPHRSRGDDTTRGETARNHVAARPASLSKAIKPARQKRRGRGAVRSAMSERGCRQYPGLKRTRASANTSGPDSTLARRPVVKLRSPQEGEPHRTKKTRFFCRTAKENSPTVDLMSRRHPLSSTRTSRRR